MQVIRVGTLIDGSGAPPVRDASVVIDNGRIETVTTADASGRRPAGAEGGADVIDASRLTALPGLIDCHDHLSFHGYELAKRGGLWEGVKKNQTWRRRQGRTQRRHHHPHARGGGGKWLDPPPPPPSPGQRNLPAPFSLPRLRPGKARGPHRAAEHLAPANRHDR